MTTRKIRLVVWVVICVLVTGISAGGSSDAVNIIQEHEIVKDLDWVLEAYDIYKSDPVTVDVERHDWGVSVSFAWDF